MKTGFPWLVLATALMVQSGAWAAGDTIYRWVDENGTVVFGEKPPQGVEARQMNVDAPMVGTQSPASAASKADADLFGNAETSDDEENLSAAEKSRRERAARRTEADANAAQVAQMCQAMRQQLDVMEPRTRVLMTEPDGSTSQIDDNTRLAMVKEAKDYIDKNNCE